MRGCKVKWLALAALVIAMAAGGRQARAVPVLWSGNGHYYDLINVDGGLSWADAQAMAAGMAYMGVWGHLAAINSAAENKWITDTFGANAIDGRWIGAFQPAGMDEALEPDGGWQWVTGEPFTYNAWFNSTNDPGWLGGEPNNGGGVEDVVVYAHGVSDVHGKAWNDADPSWTQPGFIVEYPVPEPATLGLLTIGLLGMAGARVRKRK